MSIQVGNVVRMSYTNDPYYYLVLKVCENSELLISAIGSIVRYYAPSSKFEVAYLSLLDLQQDKPELFI